MVNSALATGGSGHGGGGSQGGRLLEGHLCWVGLFLHLGWGWVPGGWEMFSARAGQGLPEGVTVWSLPMASRPFSPLSLQLCVGSSGWVGLLVVVRSVPWWPEAF